MTLIALKCPNCGGTVQFEEDMRQGFCIHCGSKIIKERVADGPIVVDKSSDIINHLTIAKEALAIHDWEFANKIVDNAILMDTECQDAWYMKALINFRNKTRYNDILMKMESKKLKNYGIFSKEDIKKCWGEHDLGITFPRRIFYPDVRATITVDGRETLITEAGERAVFGVDAGAHDISASTIIISNGKEMRFKGKTSFVASKDHEFELKLAIFRAIINIDQIS